MLAALMAVDAVAIQFVGPSGLCQTRLDKCAMSLYKEDGDLALRPRVLWNELYAQAAPPLAPLRSLLRLLLRFRPSLSSSPAAPS